MNTFKTLPIHTRLGATICTPDNFAMSARKTRLKRLLKSNLKTFERSQQLKQFTKAHKREILESLVCTATGAAIGLLYVSFILFSDI